jgi:type II secretory pathway pseudopilin PulG
MVRKISWKIAAFNLLETIIAMIIIVIVSAIAMLIFGRVVQVSLSAKRVRAAGIVHAAMLAAERKKPLNDSNYTYDDFTVFETFKANPNRTGTAILQISVTDPKGDTVFTARKTIINEK